MPNETYKAARIRLHAELATKGFKTSSPTLKVLWADSSDGTQRIWFHAQAVYLNEHSLFLDIRGMSVDTLLHHVISR